MTDQEIDRKVWEHKGVLPFSVYRGCDKQPAGGPRGLQW